MELVHFRTVIEWTKSIIFQALKLLADSDRAEALHAKLQVASIKLQLGHFRDSISAFEDILKINDSWVFSHLAASFESSFSIFCP